MNSPRALAAAGLAMLALAADLNRPAAVEQFSVYRQSRKDGAYVDWFDGQAGILGRTIKYQDLKLKPYFLEAQQAALSSGRAMLLDYLRTLSIDGTRRIGDDTETIARLRVVLDQSTPGRSEVVLPFGLTVPIKVPLFGSRSILAAVLDKVADEPAPAAPESSKPEAAGASAAVDGPTGLVVDASGLAALSPALLPRIVDEGGRVVHDLETADPAQALLRGVAAYGHRVEVRQVRPVLNKREGERPLRVAATGAAGPGNVWVVVSTADADRVLAAAETSGFLKSCRVLILAPPAGSRAAAPVPSPSPRKPTSKPAPAKER